jgi:hypothetical protein
MNITEGELFMSLRRILAVAVLSLGLSTAAYADILAGGSIYGGTKQKTAVCYLFNASTGSIAVVAHQILREDGARLPLSFDNCSTLLAGRSCRIVANIATTGAHACKITITPSAADVRGALEIRSDTDDAILNSVELR